MDWQKAKRERKRKSIFLFMLSLWLVTTVVFLAVRIARPDKAVLIYNDGGEAEWINVQAQPDAPLTAKEKLVKEMDEIGNRFLNGEVETPTDEGFYIP